MIILEIKKVQQYWNHIIIFKERHFIYIYSRVYINEGKDRVMVMHIENFTKPLYLVLVMHFFKINYLKLFCCFFLFMYCWIHGCWKYWYKFKIGINGPIWRTTRLTPKTWSRWIWIQTWRKNSITHPLKMMGVIQTEKTINQRPYL